MSFDPRDYEGVTFAGEHAVDDETLCLSVIERMDRKNADDNAKLTGEGFGTAEQMIAELESAAALEIYRAAVAGKPFARQSIAATIAEMRAWCDQIRAGGLDWFQGVERERAA